jgi:hypothetical protein
MCFITFCCIVTRDISIEVEVKPCEDSKYRTVSLSKNSRLAQGL